MIHTVNVNAVRESPTNPRKALGDLEGLASSMRSGGIIHPITVRPTGDGHFECVVGHRRLRAARAIGLESIPATVREMTDAEVVNTQLIENLQRHDMHPIEEAEVYRKIVDHGLLSAEEIAKAIGKSRSHVYDRLKLCDLTPPVQRAVLKHEIAGSTALLVAREKTPEKQIEALGALTKMGKATTFREAARALGRESPAFGQTAESKKEHMQDRRTPRWLFDHLNERFGPFILDAFAEKRNALCENFYTRADDGCTKPWEDATFGNPEFENMEGPIKQAVHEGERGRRSCIIGPVGCSQAWYHQLAIKGTVYVPDRRISFDLPDGTPTHEADRDTIVMCFGRGHDNVGWRKGSFKVKRLKLEGVVPKRERPE